MTVLCLRIEMEDIVIGSLNIVKRVLNIYLERLSDFINHFTAYRSVISSVYVNSLT